MSLASGICASSPAMSSNGIASSVTNAIGPPIRLMIQANRNTNGKSVSVVSVAEVKKLLDAARTPRPLEHFEQGPRMSSLETEGGDLDPTTRMNLREAGGLLSNVAQKCAKPLPDAAEFTVYLPKALTDSSRTETNLSPEAQSCMTTGLGLMGMQLSLLFAQSSKPPAALHITIADLPRADGARGQLVFHFRN